MAVLVSLLLFSLANAFLITVLIVLFGFAQIVDEWSHLFAHLQLNGRPRRLCTHPHPRRVHRKRRLGEASSTPRI